MRFGEGSAIAELDVIGEGEEEEDEGEGEMDIMVELETASANILKGNEEGKLEWTVIHYACLAR